MYEIDVMTKWWFVVRSEQTSPIQFNNYIVVPWSLPTECDDWLHQF